MRATSPATAAAAAAACDASSRSPKPPAPTRQRQADTGLRRTATPSSSFHISTPVPYDDPPSRYRHIRSPVGDARSRRAAAVRVVAAHVTRLKPRRTRTHTPPASPPLVQQPYDEPETVQGGGRAGALRPPPLSRTCPGTCSRSCMHHELLQGESVYKGRRDDPTGCECRRQEMRGAGAARERATCGRHRVDVAVSVS